MIAFAEAATTTEIRTETTRAVLFEDAVDPALVQFGQQEVRCEERVTDQHAGGLVNRPGFRGGCLV